ncbi:MAG TPA: MBL fold metallo-hydrolase [Kiritimatiellia bacterium]|nr:MBL fold metallo-hydrolase [Kiritimatiellia bacterium]HPS09177.1 MBL fold metallo-hydrolase [Kiritimatiellia bacterium]
MHANGIAVTLLSDNRAAYGLEAEHGLSLWIETAGHKILFDTGRGEAMLRNAEALGIDLGLADCVVLSHGHYDHTGNVSAVLGRAGHARLFLHPHAVQSRFSIHDAPKPIGMPKTSEEAIRSLPEERRCWVSTPWALAEGVMLTGPVPRLTAYEDTGGPFFLDEAGKHADAIADDLSIWVRTGAGLVVCLGCCHAGIINTLRYAVEISGEPRILAVIGGMHLLHAIQARLDRTVEALQAYDVSYLYPCHCTGEGAVSDLRQRLRASVQPGFAGMKISF